MLSLTYIIISAYILLFWKLQMTQVWFAACVNTFNQRQVGSASIIAIFFEIDALQFMHNLESSFKCKDWFSWLHLVIAICHLIIFLSLCIRINCRILYGLSQVYNSIRGQPAIFKFVNITCQFSKNYRTLTIKDRYWNVIRETRKNTQQRIYI